MHELALMEALRERALEQAERHGGGTIRAITLRVGSLAGVELEALELAFAVVMEREGPEGVAPVQLRIESVAAKCYCYRCACAFLAADGCCECPDCGQISRDLLQGRELDLVSLELDE
jgi:hydrogenase nickel incorporation protein HypA/HybF